LFLIFYFGIFHLHYELFSDLTLLFGCQEEHLAVLACKDVLQQLHKISFGDRHLKLLVIVSQLNRSWKSHIRLH